MHDSLFAHLALTFGSHPENLATEALGYILRKSAGARRGLAAFLRELGCLSVEGLSWENQASSEDGARPDLVGLDASGSQAVVVEAKFWAGLTDRQPLAYLDRLPPHGTLVVVGPANRSGLLWAELCRRIVEAGRDLEELPVSSDAARAGLAGGKRMLLMSWRALLAAARRGAEEAGENNTVADIAQLQGLCERMDVEAFLPVTAEELTDHRFRRVLEFCEIVDTVTERLVKEQIASVKGLRATGGKGHYIRYMRLNNVVGASLLCDVRKWMKFGLTPLWLTIHGPAWKPTSNVEQLLAPLANGSPSRLFKTGDGFPTVPIFVPAGKELQAVEQRAFDQVVDVAQRLSALPKSTEINTEQTPEEVGIDES